MDRSKQESSQNSSGQEQQNDLAAQRDHRSLDVYGNIPLLRDNIDESDGQRGSLSLDDDGGTHFDNTDLDTVIRRVREENLCGATFKDEFEDNDVIFNPAQRLNFDDDDDDQEEEEQSLESEEEDGNKRVHEMDEEEEDVEEEVVDDIGMERDNDEVALVVQVETNEPEDGSDYFHHRPWVSGSDLVEESAVAVGLAQSQNQNVRIIEGHDSSLLDDGNPGGNAVYGYSFLQPQTTPLSPLSPLQSGPTSNDAETQNLYDSLETVPNPYGAHREDTGGDTNTSEYYSLTATNSNGNISDSFWQQEEVSMQRGVSIPPLSSHFHSSNQNLPLADISREQIPPRNFQLDHMSSSVNENQAFVVDGNVNAPHSTPEAQDMLNLELSEEGLSQNTQTYAQPLSNPSNELAASGGMPSPGRGDPGFITRQGVLDGRMYTSQNQQVNVSEHPSASGGVLLNPRTNGNSQPKNLAQNKLVGKLDVVVTSVHSDVRVTDLSMNQRQAGAGSSTSVNGNKVYPTRASGAIAKKAQIRRPAVQGSASAGDQKRSIASANTVPSANAGKVTAMSARAHIQGATSIAPAAKPKQSQTRVGTKLPAPSSGGGHVMTKPNFGDSPLNSRTNSHTSLTSVGSSNSRVGGVGKESHQYPGGYAINQSQPTDSHSGHSMPLRTDFVGGQSKHGAMLFNPPTSGHHMGTVSSQPPPQPSLQSQRPYHQIHPMQELHAGDPRSFHHPHSHGHAFGSMANAQGQMIHQHLTMASSAQNLPNVQTFHMGSLPNQALSPSGSESSQHSFNRETVATQMDAMKKVMNQSASSGHEMYSGELQSIEDVRSHLHNMLHIGPENNNAADYSGLEQIETASELMADQPVNRQLQFDTDSSSLFGSKGGEDMSEILENFPAFSSKMFSEMSGVANKSDNHVHSENQYLRESFEKERYRRKHCEDQIQRLNSKLLEVQQQLAVAISTDKRKDTMIEQLDKQLAKVVEGWKKREADKDEALKTLTEEKGRIDESLQRQQAMINNFEHDLAQTVDELKEERKKSSETIHGLRKELTEAKSAKDKADDSLRITKKKCESLEGEWDTLKQSHAITESRVQQAQEKLMKEQDSWNKKEQELLEKITLVKDANQKVINMEKVKLEEQKKKREVAESEGQELKAELKRLVLDTEQLVREKESQKVEASIMEAKFDSAQRKLEADLHSQMEKEIADQASEFHTRLENAMDEANERHRTQVADIHKRHQKDMERQLAASKEEREKKEDDYKRQISELEARVTEVRSENSGLKQSKLKLESQRMEILTKLQFMMQSQWNEAVSLLVSTPQKKNVQSPFLSTSGGLQLSSLVMPSSSGPHNNQSVTTPQSTMPSQHKTKVVDCSASENGRASSTSSSGRERNMAEEAVPLDRVEEYLQRLNLPSEIAMSGDDSQASDAGSAVLVTNDRVPDGKALTHSNQLPLSGEQSNQTSQAFTEKDSSSHLQQPHSTSQPSHHQKSHFLSMLNGDIPTSLGARSSGPSLVSGFQALPIRSPQQMSRLTHGIDSSVSIRDSNGQVYSFSDLSFKNNVPGQGNRQFYPHNLYSSHVQQQQHQHHHHQQPPRQENILVHCKAPSSQSNASKLATGPNRDHQGAGFTFQPPHLPDVTVHVSGDCGDQVNRPRQYLDLNRNLLNSSSPVSVSSSPSGITPISSTSTHKSGKGQNWSPDNSMNLPKMCLNQSSPDRNQSEKSYSFNGESPMPWPSRQGNRMGNIGSSLSPPVRQVAEKDQTDALSEDSSEMPDSRLDVNYSQMSEQMDEHMSRHEELQHYIQLLLQKAPGRVALEPERDGPQDLDILESSRDLTDKNEEGEDSVDLDLNDTAQAYELTLQLTRLQELRERQQQPSQPNGGRPPQLNQTNVNRQQQPRQQQQLQHHLTNGSGPPQHMSNYIGDDGVMNAQGLTEISQLLSMYREQWESNPEMANQVNTAGRLIQVLKGASSDTSFESAPRNDLRKPLGGKKSPRGTATKKSQDSSGNKSKKKTANHISDTSGTTTPDSLERSQNSGNSKGGGTVATVTAKKSQEVVKEARRTSSVTGAKQGPKGGGPVWK